MPFEPTSVSADQQEPTALVATPRNLDKSWSRLLRGDRTGAFDAMSLIGAVATIVTVSLAKMELWPWFPVYLSAGTWGLGFLLGTRAQMRSGRQRRLALTEGDLVALGVVEAEESLTQGQGRRAPVGRALVLMALPGAEGLRDAPRISEVAKQLKASLDERAQSNASLAALRKDRFSFERVPVSLGNEDWTLTRVIIQGERRGAEAGPIESGTVVWGIYHPETDILEQALLS